MVPINLTVKNFLCYRENVPTVHLEGFRVACLCGQNGHGKSALLDAITWALWGRARGKNQDELIYYGAGEMLVELDFEARGGRYRVTRRHARAGGGARRGASSDLQLQVHDGSQFLPITGNVIRETQRKIDQLIGMDYDTFINSAFLLQGRADEFTNRTPGERKQVLAKVMGLEEYDRLQEQARERASKKRQEANVVDAGLEHLGQQALRQDELQTRLANLQQDLKQVEFLLGGKSMEVDALKHQVDTLHRFHKDLEDLRERMTVIQQDLEYMQVDLESRRSRILTYRASVVAKDSIKDRIRSLDELRIRYERMVNIQARYDELRARRSDLSGPIEVQQLRLVEQAQLLEHRVIEELIPRASTADDVLRRLEQAAIRLESLQLDEVKLEDCRRLLSLVSVEIGGLRARLEALRFEGEELKTKLGLLGDTEEGTMCPLCGTGLGSEDCQHLANSYDIQIREKRHMYLEAQSKLKLEEQRKSSLEKEFLRLQTYLQGEHRENQGLVAKLERDLQDSQQAKDGLQQTQAQLSEVRRHLEERTYALEEQAQLADVNSQLKELAYDSEAQGKLYQEIKQLQPVEDEHRRLLEAEGKLSEEEEALVHAEGMLKRRQSELTEIQTRRDTASKEVADLPVIEKKLGVEQSSLRDLDGKRVELLALKGNVDGELSRIGEMLKQISKDRKMLARLREEQQVYEALDEAFGRKGVQAMLIETLLPSLEDEANILLGRMTDHRMNLKLEAQRERRSQKGEPIETLDITISDELGPRNYEMFSGGEAFRINLALRIALSKVLANRRGAPLPTLFIDEGFGTQDGAGRERIQEVIRAIEDDFLMIIVITHLEDLKDAFEARIQVEKTVDGATVWLT